MSEKNYVVACAQSHAIEFLEAVERMEPAARISDLPEVAGYSGAFCHYGVAYLKDCGLVSRLTGFAHLTERGRIALAIYRGKQRRKQWLASQCRLAA